jgi:glycogen operon protein
VVALRARQIRNFLTTLLVSQGVPMLAHGDELGRTQGGNNNAYCQDNEISWVDWDLKPWQKELLAFTGRVVALRQEHPVFRRRRFFAGHSDAGLGDIVWFNAAGEHMSAADWNVGHLRSLTVFVNGDAIEEPDSRGQRIYDDSFLILFNAHYDDLPFHLPPSQFGTRWEHVADTADLAFRRHRALRAGSQRSVKAHSLVVLRRAE